MYANDPEMAEKWEKHTPKGTSLQKKVKKKKRKKKADLNLIVKIANLYAFAAELKDRFDYLRQIIRAFKFILQDKEGYDPEKLIPIETLLSQKHTINWQTAKEDVKPILEELYKLRKYLMSIKQWQIAGLIHREYQQLARLGEYSKEYYSQFAKQPRQEFAQPHSTLYHGTNPADAYSVLKNRKFHKSTAFANLSFTSDLTAAAKFGNVVFAFNAGAIQRRRAKKMRYYPEKQYLEMLNKGRESESYKDLFISDMYKYEREWAVPLPFPFDGADLEKVIVLKQEDDGSEKVKEKLEEVAPPGVKIDIQYLPAYSQHSSSTMEWQDVKYGELKYFVYKNIIDKVNKIKSAAREIGKEQAENIKKKYPGESVDYLLKNDNTIRTANFLINIMPSMSHNSTWWHKSDLDTLVSDLQNASWNSDRYKNTPFESIIPHMNDLKDEIDPLKKEFAKTYLTNEDDYIKGMIQGGKYGLGQYKDSYLNWARVDPKDLEKVLEHEDYEKFYGKNGATSMRTVLEELTNDPTVGARALMLAVPIKVWREYPEVLARHPFLHELDGGTLHMVFYNNPKVDKYLIESIAPDGWASDRAYPENEERMAEIYRIINPG